MRKTLPLAAAALLSTVFAIPASAQEADQQLLLKQPQAGATSKQQDATPDQAQGAAEQKSDQQSNTAGAEQPKKESSKDAAAAERSQNNADEAASVKPKESDGKNAASNSDEQKGGASKNAASKQDRVNADTAKSDSQDDATENAAQANEGQDVSKETTASVNITTEQRTEIRKVIVHDAPPPVHLDINVSVGVAVPHTVELRPLPPRVIKIVPQYKGYRFFVLADGRIIIVQPKTYKVVYVLTA